MVFCSCLSNSDFDRLKAHALISGYKYMCLYRRYVYMRGNRVGGDSTHSFKVPMRLTGNFMCFMQKKSPQINCNRKFMSVGMATGFNKVDYFKDLSRISFRWRCNECVYCFTHPKFFSSSLANLLAFKREENVPRTVCQSSRETGEMLLMTVCVEVGRRWKFYRDDKLFLSFILNENCYCKNTLPDTQPQCFVKLETKDSRTCALFRSCVLELFSKRFSWLKN